MNSILFRIAVLLMRVILFNLAANLLAQAITGLFQANQRIT
jgi:hypothetical protein